MTRYRAHSRRLLPALLASTLLACNGCAGDFDAAYQRYQFSPTSDYATRPDVLRSLDVRARPCAARHARAHAGGSRAR
jgi:hypothetical protein